MSLPQAPSQARRTRSRSPVSRPTTPLRPSSRSSFRNSQNNGFTGSAPLDAFEPQFAELSDSMADLEANLMHLQLMHESLSRFGESFASFLYGLNMNAFVVDFPEAPIVESIKRYQKRQGLGADGDTTIIPNTSATGGDGGTANIDATFMTADASFASLKATPRRKTMGSSATPSTTSTVKNSTGSVRGNIPGRGRGGSGRGTRGSGLPRGRGRGTK